MKNNTYKKGGGYFPEYDSFAPPRMANGGGLLSRTVTCSSCGHSWKAVDGGKDVMTCHKCGGMIKMKHGGSYLPKAQVGMQTDCPEGFVNIDGNCIKKESYYYKRLLDEGRVGTMKDDVWYGNKAELPEVTVYASRDKDTQAFYDFLRQNTNQETNDALLGLSNEYPNPKVSMHDKPGFLSPKFSNGAYRPNYNPFTQRINLRSNPGSVIGDYIAELAHHKQLHKKGATDFIFDAAGDIIKSTPNYEDLYYEEGNFEHDAHENIEPQLRKEFTKRKFDNYFKTEAYEQPGSFYMNHPQWKTSKKKEGGDISIPDLNSGNWLSKYKESSKRFDTGGITCGKGQVRFADENGERCIDINSQEYKDIYTKGIGTFQKYNKSKNKWVAATQDDTDAVFTTNNVNLPEVTVKGKFDPAKRAEYLKKQKEQQERLVGSTTPNYNTSESTRNQPMIDLKNRDSEQQEIINNWKKRNPYGVGLSDVEVQNRIAIENDMRSKNDSLRELTPQESQQLEINEGNEAWRRKTFGPFAGGTEGEKIDRWRKEDEEHNAAVAETNSAMLAKNNGQPFTFPTGVTKKWSEMDGREKAYVIGVAQSRGLKLFPGATADQTLKTTLDELNPFPILNDWTKGFATSPYVARETDSYMPYVSAVADPALTIAAVMAGQPELTPGKALTGNILNWKKPLQNIGKAMVAAEEGELLSYGINKLRKDEIKNIGKEINDSLKDNTASNTENNVQRTPTEMQLAQLKNTPSNQGVNSLGLFNPTMIKNYSKPSLSVIPFPGFRKYGGSTKKMKNWTDKYK